LKSHLHELKEVQGSRAANATAYDRFCIDDMAAEARDERVVPASKPRPMEIFVKGWDGNTFNLFVAETDTVITVMTMIKGKTFIPLSEQRLIFAGKQLEH
jgi:hypothetical protein